jgi:branched-chain amino acid transport system ATP-binding protein
MSILVVEDLGKSYSGFQAVRNVSFALEAGEMLALIGPNGAGKSTCFNMIDGQLAPTTGRIAIFGKSTAGMTPGDIWRLGVGRTFQVAATFASMTVVENVQMALLSHHPRRWPALRWAARYHQAEAERLLALVSMANQAQRSCGELAYGDLKRLELAIALANDPKLLLMDEPAAGMAPPERHALMGLTGRIARERTIGVRSRRSGACAQPRDADRRGRACGGARQRRGSGGLSRRGLALRGPFVSVAKLSVAQLDAAYGQAQVLFDVSLEIGAGEAVALLGRNGAGKSTTFRAILGLIARRSGRIVFDGEDISKHPAYDIARRGLGYVPEDRRIFSDLTVEENLLVGRQPPRPNAPTWTPERLFAIFPNLRELRGRAGARMSGGEQQMLTIARTLMGNPSLLLLDEPSEGLAPRIVEQMIEAIREVKREGLSLFVSEQNLAFARLVAERVYVIEKGGIRFAGTMAEFDGRPDVRDAYLAF